MKTPKKQPKAKGKPELPRYIECDSREIFKLQEQTEELRELKRAQAKQNKLIQETVSDFKNRIRNIMRGLPADTINGASHAHSCVVREKRRSTLPVESFSEGAPLSSPSEKTDQCGAKLGDLTCTRPKRHSGLPHLYCAERWVSEEKQ